MSCASPTVLVAGTLTVLDLAARRGVVNLSEALLRLEGTTAEGEAIWAKESAPG